MGLPRLRTFAGTDLGTVSRLAANSDGIDGQQMDGLLKNRPAYMGLPCLHGVTNAMRFAGTDFEVVSRPNFLQKSISPPLDLRRFRIVLVLASPRRSRAIAFDRDQIAVVFPAVVAILLKFDDVVAAEYCQQFRQVERRRSSAVLKQTHAIVERLFHEVVVQLCRHVLALEFDKPGRCHQVSLVWVKH